MKKKLLIISFSGGETSAFMVLWLWKHKRHEYEMIVVFANTGQENEETLQFVQNFSVHYGIPTVWVEAVVHYNKRKATSHKVVDFYSANRDGRPFEDIIKKYGIPNQAFPHCTREMKAGPILSYVKSIGWENHYTAIGIRIDEFDRMAKKAKEKRFYYPLVKDQPMTKKKINFFWSQQKFRLNLKGYQGNCITCWKKHDPKLYQIAMENEQAFNFFAKMELRYEKFVPETRLKLMADRGELPTIPVRFFRRNRSVQDIISESKESTKIVIDDSMAMDSESCEVFTECGIDN